MSLLPSRPDASAADDAEPRVVGVDSDDADELLSALSSETARRLLGELHDDPAPPGELADRVDTSLQNAQYHLSNLREAGAVEVVDTAYSKKGREMDVYAPADKPLVIFAGDETETTSIRTALTRLLGGVGVLAVASLAVQQLFGDGVGALFGGGGGAGGAAPATEADGAAALAGTPTPGGMSVADAGTETPTAVPTDPATAAAAASGLSPGVLFFLGGATVLVAGFVVWYASQ